MEDFLSDATVLIATGCGLFSLVITYYVGYVSGKNKANTVTYSALNTLITEWNKLIRQMPIMPASGPKLDIRKKT